MPYPALTDRRGRSLVTGWALAVVLSCLMLPLPQVAASSLRRSAIVKAVSEARPAVVNIHGRKSMPAEHDQTGMTDSGNQVNGMGTGILIDDRGYIITNYHVVEGVKRIRVTLADQSTLVAELVANDPKTDLAIIKVPSEMQFPVIRIGTSSDLMPGETVVAVGNAYGYEHTVTQGIISALHRTVQVSDYQKYVDLIQTDASINPGNSGGPLLNIDGDMIGINVAVRVGAQGIGFAIPIDEAMEVAAHLLSCERLGSVTYGATVKTSYETGGPRVVVQSVAADGPAYLAGLKPGDVLTMVDGQPIDRRLDLERLLIDRQSGEELDIELYRGGEPIATRLVLKEMPGLERVVPDQAWTQLGLRFAPVPANTFRRYSTRYRGGLRVTAVREDSSAAANGIRRGDILVGMHKWETISEENVSYILSSPEFKATQPFKFYILRNSDTLFGTMRAEFD